MVPRILVIGACGQIGSELTLALRGRFGPERVVASDLRGESDLIKGTGPFLPFDIMNREMLLVQVRKLGITTIYHLAAMLSAAGEQNPHKAWQLNMDSLLNVLEVAREENISRVFWPSSIAVFGPDAPKRDCPQETVLTPATVYGISKAAGEQWCNYYHHRYGLDVRSLRYPGLISYKTHPGGGTTDYAIEIFGSAIKGLRYKCFLKPDTILPMMYMDDAVRATLELMEVPPAQLSVRTSYNLAAISFTPAEIAAEIKRSIPGFQISYEPDFRQAIAESWPGSIDDSAAAGDWNWKPRFELVEMCRVMIENSSKTLALTGK